MKKTITPLFFLTVFGVASLLAQIPLTSPIPVDFRVTTAAGYDNTFDYGTASGADWGTDTLVQTVSGQLVWAYDITPDSLCCDSIPTDLTGKMAMIRRGDCNFSLKMLWAQKAGATGVVIINQLETGAINMGGGTYGGQVQLPAILISRADGDIIKAKVESGEVVTGTFQVKSFGTPLAYYSLNTPVTGAAPLEDISITYINTGPNTIPSVTINTDITDPNGGTTTLTKTLTDVPGFSVSNVVMDDSYLPTMVGEYNVHYSNSLSDDTFDKKFNITDYTYAQDNDVIDETQDANGVFNGTIEPSPEDFVSRDIFRYDFGNFYRTGAQSQVATHVTFVIGSYNELWTGDPEADVFKVRVYDADPDGNGIVPDATTYDALDEADGSNPPIGGADYILDGATPNFTRTILELDEPITLQPNKIYLVMVQYDGISAGIGIPPKPALGIGTSETVAGGLSSARFGDRFYYQGWSSTFAKFVVRLHVDGFTDAKEKPLDQSKISIAPNPVSSVLNLDLSLEKAADKVDLRVMDFTGRLVKTERLENVHQGTYSLNVQDLAVGTYFLSVSTPEGFRAKKFVVAR